MLSGFSRVQLFVTPWTVACQAPLSMEFSRQEYWGVLPFPSPGNLPEPVIKHGSPALQADSLPAELPGKSDPKLDFPPSLGVLELLVCKSQTRRKCPASPTRRCVRLWQCPSDPWNYTSCSPKDEAYISCEGDLLSFFCVSVPTL